MKTVTLFAALALTPVSFSQDLDFCNYFSVKFNMVEYEGQQYQSCEPIIPAFRKDKVNRFFETHSNRFEYIFYKYIDDFKTLGRYYPDSAHIQKVFCDSILHSERFGHYFSSLTPGNLGQWKGEKEVYTRHELMLVASRFFYCDAIDKTDTTIQSHICIGINGQKDIVSARDYTLLEAFSSEAIFHYLGKRKDPLFYKQFITFRNNARNIELGSFTDYDSFLLAIRKLCYDYMQQNADLQEKLLEYYSKNRDNLNLEIR